MRRAALEAVAQLLVEKEVIDGDELRELLIKHYPGPKLVPGTIARHADQESFSEGPNSAADKISERRVEGGVSGG